MQLIAFYQDEPIRTKDATVRQVPIAEAVKYDFGNEPLVVRTVYVEHPRIASRLVPYGQYDNLVMTDKFNEALRIVQTLGAHTVITRSYRGDRSRASLKGQLRGVGPQVDVASSSGDEFAFEQYGTGGHPLDPGPSLYPNEAGFDAATRAVLMNGARRVSLTIESHSAFRLDSDVAAQLKKFGFSLGADGEKAQTKELRLEAHFPEKGKLHEPDAAGLNPLPPPPKMPSELAAPARKKR